MRVVDRSCRRLCKRLAGLVSSIAWAWGKCSFNHGGALGREITARLPTFALSEYLAEGLARGLVGTG